MKKEKELKFTVENTGGVESAELILRAGVNILRGRNGVGKTSCIDAVVRASGGKVAIQKKDGTEEGRVTGPGGVTLTIRSVVKTTGAAALELAEVGPLGRLIDPGLKDTKAAARERVRALVELLGLGVDDSRLLALCGENAILFDEVSREVKDHATDNLLEASERLRHLIHAKARRHEDLEAVAEAEVANTLEECRGLLEDLEPAGLVESSVEDATRELEAAIRTHDRALGACEAREKLEAQQNAIRDTVGDRPDTKAAEAALVAATADEELERHKLTEARDAVRELEDRAAAAGLHSEFAAERLDQVRKALEKWTDQNEILERTPEGPARGDLEKLRDDLVGTATENLKRARLSADFKKREAAHNAAVVAETAAAEKSKALRDLAAGIPGKLGKLLAEAGAPGLTVLEGRLHVIGADGAPRDFEHRCSTGERVAAALAVAAEVYRGRVLSLSGDVWGALDPTNRRVFAEVARARDLCVLTEEPAAGVLRLELAGGSETRATVEASGSGSEQ